MDGKRFDRLMYALATGVSRRGLAGLVTVALGGAAALSGAPEPEAKKKKPKKRKPKPKPTPTPTTTPEPTCKAIQRACNYNAQDCCDGMKCGYTWCAFTDVCYREAGGPCSEACDCYNNLGCSERSGTCSATCRYPQEPSCASDDDCCLTASTCVSRNRCGQPNVCCQATGGTCFDQCDCCNDTCNQRTNRCGSCTQLAASCQKNDDCCSLTAVCGTGFTGAAHVCCEPAGGSCAFNAMCCDGLTCNPFTNKCVAASSPRREATSGPKQDHAKEKDGSRRWRPNVPRDRA